VPVVDDEPLVVVVEVLPVDELEVVVPPEVVDPVGPDDGVPLVVAPVAGLPVIAAFRSANGMFRFCETCSAATNCPWFLKPVEAFSSVIPDGSIF